MKRSKVVGCEGIELSSVRIMNEVEREVCRYLGIVESGKSKKRRNKLNGRNKIMAVNTWTVALLR